MTPTVYDVLAACRDPNGVSVRMERWKYPHYASEPGESYDLWQDPAEGCNLFHDEARCSVREQMQRLLEWRIAMPTNGYSTPQRGNPYLPRYFENMLPGTDARTER